MVKRISKWGFYLVMAACALVTLASSAPAQTAASPEEEFRLVRLRHVAPDLMAHWINPQRHPLSREMLGGLEFFGITREQFNQRIPQIKAFEHKFSGQVMPVRAQNAIGVYSTEEAFERNKNLIEAVDKPQSMLEISVQLLSMGPDVMKILAGKLVSQENRVHQSSPANIFLLTQTMQSELARLIEAGKIQQQSNLRSTALNNYPVGGGVSNTTPVDVTLTAGQGSASKSLAVTEIPGKKVGLEVLSRIAAIPAVRPDKSIAVTLSVSRAASLVDYEKASSRTPSGISREETSSRLFLQHLGSSPLIFDYVVDDGQTILITDAAELIYGAVKPKATARENMIVAVTLQNVSPR